MLSDALKIAELGWAVFPVATGGMLPAISKEKGGRGFLDATTAPAAITQFWQPRSAANIGIACGASGLLVLDIDPRHGGDESLLGLIDPHGEAWTATVSSTTPSGGTHFYFGDDRGLRNSASKIAPGVDIRGDGGYVVAPPSRRRDGDYQ